jgi:glycerophosphoryl diester phosphodiesterase
VWRYNNLDVATPSERTIGAGEWIFGCGVTMFIAVSILAFFPVVATCASLGKVPRIIAHRGASADAPENTLAAFRLAWEQGADGIEGDFYLTADGRIVCIHDEDTERVAGVRHAVQATSYDDLRALDVGAWKGMTWKGERIPLLEEVLAIVPEGKQAFLELKSRPAIVGPLVDVLKASALVVGQIVIMSFDAEVVHACKERMPQFKCLWLTDYKEQNDGTWRPRYDEVIATIRRTGADGLGSENRPEIVNEKFVGRLRAAGIDEIHIWTVDDVRDAQHFSLLSVTSLITNRPGLLQHDM